MVVENKRKQADYGRVEKAGWKTEWKSSWWMAPRPWIRGSYSVASRMNRLIDLKVILPSPFFSPFCFFPASFPGEAKFIARLKLLRLHFTRHRLHLVFTPPIASNAPLSPV